MQNPTIPNHIYLNLRNRRNLWFIPSESSMSKNLNPVHPIYPVILSKIFSKIAARKTGACQSNHPMSAPSGSVKSGKRTSQEKQANACQNLSKHDQNLSKHDHFLTEIVRNVQKSSELFKNHTPKRS